MTHSNCSIHADNDTDHLHLRPSCHGENCNMYLGIV